MEGCILKSNKLSGGLGFQDLFLFIVIKEWNFDGLSI